MFRDFACTSGILMNPKTKTNLSETVGSTHGALIIQKMLSIFLGGFSVDVRVSGSCTEEEQTKPQH